MTILLCHSGLLNNKYVLFQKALSCYNFIVDNNIKEYLVITDSAENITRFITNWVVDCGYTNAHLGDCSLK